MKTISLGPTDVQVGRLCYGAMRITGTWDKDKVGPAEIAKGIASLEAAVEAGYTFIDHADIYGDTTCEMVHGLAYDKHPEWRDKLFIATKCGIRFEDEPPGTPHRYDFDGKYIRESCEGSLQRLKTDRIDLYQLHRPDFLADPEEIASAFVDLHQAGKVRYFGVSNFRPSLVSAVQAALPFPLVSNQVEIHLLRLATFEDGTLDQCLEKKLTPLAWSPIGGGRLASAIDPTKPKHENAEVAAANERIGPVLADVAQAYSTTPLAILFAWLMRHPSHIVPIVGTTRPEAIKESVKADDIELDRESWYRILRAARGVKLP